MNYCSIMWACQIVKCDNILKGRERRYCIHSAFCHYWNTIAKSSKSCQVKSSKQLKWTQTTRQLDDADQLQRVNRSNKASDCILGAKSMIRATWHSSRNDGHSSFSDFPVTLCNKEISEMVSVGSNLTNLFIGFCIHVSCCQILQH